jgi:hypothetical protein
LAFKTREDAELFIENNDEELFRASGFLVNKITIYQFIFLFPTCEVFTIFFLYKITRITFFHKIITVWNSYLYFSEIVSSYCYKGSKVYVEGKLQTDQYEKNGETRYSTKIVVDEFKGTVQFLDKTFLTCGNAKVAHIFIISN